MAKKSKIAEKEVSPKKIKVEIAICAVVLVVLGCVFSFCCGEKSKHETTLPVGGCVTSQDFININILLQNASNFDNLETVLGKVRFEHGKLYFPEIGNDKNNLPAYLAADLAAVKAFFNKVHIYRVSELEMCRAVFANARMSYANMNN